MGPHEDDVVVGEAHERGGIDQRGHLEGGIGLRHAVGGPVGRQVTQQQGLEVVGHHEAAPGFGLVQALPGGHFLEPDHPGMRLLDDPGHSGGPLGVVGSTISW